MSKVEHTFSRCKSRVLHVKKKEKRKEDDSQFTFFEFLKQARLRHIEPPRLAPHARERPSIQIEKSTCYGLNLWLHMQGSDPTYK